jgi:hypothetical protein
MEVKFRFIRFVTIWPALLCLGFIPLSYLYAILRQDVINLDRVVNRTVVYFFLFLTLAILYFGLSAGGVAGAVQQDCG